MKNKAIIFDLDGVIVDTAKYHFIAWQKIAKDLGFDFTHTDNEKLKGVSRVQSLELILQMAKRHLTQAEKDKLLVEKNEHYLSLISDMSSDELLPGMADLLDYLVQHKIPFALGSASKNARRILDALSLTDKFTAIVDGTDVSKAKPDPEVFLIAAQKLDYPPKDCIVIEDSKSGIEAANSVGMTSVGIGDKEVLKNANFVLKSTSELNPKWIENILN